MALSLDVLRKLLAKLFFLRLLPGLLRGEMRGLFLERSKPGLAEWTGSFKVTIIGLPSAGVGVRIGHGEAVEI